MDRFDSLLQTLLQQRAENATPGILLNTLALLQFELQKTNHRSVTTLGTSKVAVQLPEGQLPSFIAENSSSPVTKEVEKRTKEVNETVIPDASLNDRLRDEKPVLADTMLGSPIKDLRKGISLNERYQLVKELFEGDEILFDKTIKTINAFSNGAEAQFWIDKELKAKGGWKKESPAAHLFDQLIKRRFS